MGISTEALRDKAVEVARAGGLHTLKFFNKKLSVDRKADQSPVTQADREAEQIMRNIIKKAYPQHGIIGEEFGRENPSSPIQWIFDPIDGTRSFIHGVPLYTTLVGVTVDGRPVAGVIFAPAVDELCEAAVHLGCRLNGTTVRVRSCTKLEEATFLSTDVTHARRFNLEVGQQTLIDRCRLHRTWGDAYGHMLVATGRADIMFDAVLNIWDAAPLLPIIEEAGGIFSDTDGNKRIDGPNGLSTNTKLHKEIMEVFAN